MSVIVQVYLFYCVSKCHGLLSGIKPSEVNIWQYIQTDEYFETVQFTNAENTFSVQW